MKKLSKGKREASIHLSGETVFQEDGKECIKATFWGIARITGCFVRSG